MTTAHVDCATGPSGEMWLGAVVDAGASLETIQDAVGRLGPGEVRITFGRVRRAGVDAVSVRVRPPQDTAPPTSWPAVRSILEDAGLAGGVRDRSHAVFRSLFEAEAGGGAVDEVRFPAVGGLDMLGDVVGTCAGLVDLGIERLTVGPARSRRPELGTPTGRALVAALAGPGEPPAADEVERIGIGAGEVDLPGTAHVLRLLVRRAPHERGAGAGARDPHVEPPA